MTKFVKYFALGLILAAVFFWLGKGCDEPKVPVKDKSDSLRGVIRGLLVIQDSLKDLAQKEDSVRVKYVTKWRGVRSAATNTTSPPPCDSILPIVINTCDSVIAKDSVVIAVLNEIIDADSAIIANKDKLILADSLTIVGLNKDVKRLKRQKRWLIVAIVAITGIAIIK